MSHDYKSFLRIFLLSILAAACLSACTGQPTAPTATATAVPTATPEPTATPAPLPAGMFAGETADLLEQFSKDPRTQDQAELLKASLEGKPAPYAVVVNDGKGNFEALLFSDGSYLGRTGNLIGKLLVEKPLPIGRVAGEGQDASYGSIDPDGMYTPLLENTEAGWTVTMANGEKVLQKDFAPFNEEFLAKTIPIFQNNDGKVYPSTNGLALTPDNQVMFYNDGTWAAIDTPAGAASISSKDGQTTLLNKDNQLLATWDADQSVWIEALAPEIQAKVDQLSACADKYKEVAANTAENCYIDFADIADRNSPLWQAARIVGRTHFDNTKDTRNHDVEIKSFSTKSEYGVMSFLSSEQWKDTSKRPYLKIPFRTKDPKTQVEQMGAVVIWPNTAEEIVTFILIANVKYPQNGVDVGERYLAAALKPAGIGINAANSNATRSTCSKVPTVCELLTNYPTAAKLAKTLTQAAYTISPDFDGQILGLNYSDYDEAPR